MKGLFDTRGEDFSRFLSDYLKQAQGVQTGQIQPTQLPEYKYLSSDLTSQLPKILSAFQTEMSNKGVEGGAFTKGLSDINENYTKGLLGAERGAFEGATSKGIDVAKLLGSFREEDLNRFVTYLTAQKQIETQRDIAKMSGITSGANTGMGVGGSMASSCKCRIFTEDWTRELEAPVRRFRDDHYSPDSFVSRGYSISSDYLVPIMLRSKAFRWLIRKVMLKPMSKCASYYYKKDLRALIYAPVGYFWTGIWSMIGRLNAISR